MLAVAGLLSAAAPNEKLPAKTANAICQARKTCRIAQVLSAGNAPDGTSLRVVEIRLGLADKPGSRDHPSLMAPEEGCLNWHGENDGGSEWWLIAGSRKPELLIRLCNDGYGAAEVGEDHISVAPNRFTREQLGGSNVRWDQARTIQLSPRRTLSEKSCGYHVMKDLSGEMTWAELPEMRLWSLAQDDASTRGHDAGGLSPDLCQSLMGRSPFTKAPGLLAGIPVPSPGLGGTPPNVPPGTALGNCAVSVTAQPTRGFLVYGAPDLARAAELRLSLLGQTLLIQVLDPKPSQPAAAASWVDTDHLEIWTAAELGPDQSEYNHLAPNEVVQLGVGLDGRLYDGVGKPVHPAVTHWSTRGQHGPVQVVSLTWPEDSFALLRGVAVAYSEAEAGRQARILATTGIVQNRPVFLPKATGVPVACGVVHGIWTVTANPGALEDPVTPDPSMPKEPATANPDLPEEEPVTGNPHLLNDPMTANPDARRDAE